MNKIQCLQGLQRC